MVFTALPVESVRVQVMGLQQQQQVERQMSSGLERQEQQC
jgi:hypothetical protein